MKTVTEKIHCQSCGKKFNRGKKNYSVYCKSCRSQALKDVAKGIIKIEKIENERNRIKNC